MNNKFLEVWRLQFQIRQLDFPQNKLHVKLIPSDSILLLPNEFLCACKPHTVHTDRPVLTGVTEPGESFSSVTALSRGWDIPQGRDRHHFCLPPMETSPATFLSPRDAFRKRLSHFGLHKSSLESFSCADVALQALPGLLVVLVHRVVIFQLKDTSTALVSFFLVTETVSCSFQTLSVCFIL